MSGLFANIALTTGDTAVAACTVAVISIMSSASRPLFPRDDFIAA